MSDYNTLISNGYITTLKKVSEKNPRCYWLFNKSNAKQKEPDLAGWITEYKSLPDLFIKGGAKLKEVVLDLLNGGDGVKDASAITLMIAEYNLMDGSKVKETRTVLVGSSSLNQMVRKGQVHAEHITAASLVDKLNGADITSSFGHDKSQIKLTKVKVLSYTGKPKQGSKAVEDFAPCESCQKTLGELFTGLKNKGAAVELCGLVDKIKF